MVGDFRHVEIEAAIEQVILVLDGGDARQAPGVCDVDIFLRPPRAFVGKADGADFTGLYQFAERFEFLGDFGDRALGILTGRVKAPCATEMIGAAIRPVDLVEVDIVGLQTLEAGVDSLADRGGIDIATATNVIAS